MKAPHLMLLNPWSSSLIFLLATSFANAEITREMFGIKVRASSTEKEIENQIDEWLEQFAKDGKFFLDPDCLWRKKDLLGKCDNHLIKQTSIVQDLAEKYKKETLGVFDIEHDKKGRDFAGIWQGYALEQLQRQFAGAWLVDFSGDILVTDNGELNAPLVIGDPVFDEIPYAKVHLNKGFMIASTGPRLGGRIKAAKEGEILKVVLFAAPSFSCSRLDAWSTAIIAGGTKTLKRLWSLPKFRGTWAYFYFLPSGKPVFSGNLRVDINRKTPQVEVGF